MIKVRFISCLLFGLLFIAAAGLYCENRQLKRQLAARPVTVTEKMMDIQRQVGCKLIDGKIGPETTELVNQAVEAERKELFDKYARPYFDDEFYVNAKDF